jgi:hypothetical protein
VGDAQDLRRQMQSAGITAAIVEPEPAPGPPPASAAADVESGRQLMARALQASGGASAIAALKDVSRASAMDLSAIAGGGQRQLLETWIAPDQFRQDVSGALRFIAYTNGQGGWGSDGVGSGPLTPGSFDQLARQWFLWYPRLLSGDAFPGRTIAAVGPDAVEIREGTRSAILVFDAAGLPSKLLYEVPRAGGRAIAVEEDLLDFRAVSGVQFPFRIRTFHNGRPAALVTVRDLKVNSGLRLEELTKRP